MLYKTDYSYISSEMDNLPPKTLKWLGSNSPSHYNMNLRAPVFIMHDEADNIVPFEESQRMYDQISMFVPTKITIFNLFQNEIQLHEDESIKNNKIDLLSNGIKLFNQLNGIIDIIFK